MDLSSLDLEQFCANVGVPRVGSGNRAPSGWDCQASTCQGCPSQLQRLPQEPGARKNNVEEVSGVPQDKCGETPGPATHSPTQGPAQGSSSTSSSQPIPVSWPPMWPSPRSVI